MLASLPPMTVRRMTIFTGVNLGNRLCVARGFIALLSESWPTQRTSLWSCGLLFPTGKLTVSAFSVLWPEIKGFFFFSWPHFPGFEFLPVCFIYTCLFQKSTFSNGVWRHNEDHRKTHFFSSIHKEPTMKSKYYFKLPGSFVLVGWSPECLVLFRERSMEMIRNILFQN